MKNDNSIVYIGEGSLGYNPYIFGKALTDHLNESGSPEWNFDKDRLVIFCNDYSTPDSIDIEDLMKFIKENKHWIE